MRLASSFSEVMRSEARAYVKPVLDADGCALIPAYLLRV
jgi:hypothetical protein